MGIVSVYGNLVPNLEAYSVDKPHGTPTKSSVSNLIVTICITIHLSVMYYVCGMAKYVMSHLQQREQSNATLKHRYGLKTWDDGDKIFLIAHTGGVMTENAELLRAFPLLCRFLTHSTVYLEIFAFLIFIFPVPLIRCLGIIVMIGLHVGISLFLYVVGFNYSMIALLVLLMPPIFYDALERIGKSLFRNCSVVVSYLGTISTIPSISYFLICDCANRFALRGFYIYVMSRSWYGEQRQETLSWTRRSSWCTQSVGKILVSASRMAFRRAWWISDTSSVCVRSVHSLTHSLSHSLSNTNQPTNRYGGREFESIDYILAWTNQNDILTLYDNSKVVPLKTKAPVWDPDFRESKYSTNKFKNFFQSASKGKSQCDWYVQISLSSS